MPSVAFLMITCVGEFHLALFKPIQLRCRELCALHILSPLLDSYPLSLEIGTLEGRLPLR